MRRLHLLLLAFLLVSGSLAAQERRVMNRPYIDERRLHWGFMFGMQMQDMEMCNNGYIDPETGEQWYADVDNYSPGFTVGILGEMKLNRFLALRLIPTLHFGQKHISFHEQVTGRDTTQNFRSTYIMLPVNLKFSAPRYNNFRPYVVTGVAPSLDLTGHKHRAIDTKPVDCFIEIGMGCDIYFPFFKLIPELKLSFGLLDILKKNRDDLIDGTLMKFTDSLDKAHSKMITLTLYFE